MCMPLIASLLDEEEVQSLLFLVASLIKARSPEVSDQLMLAAQEAMIALDRITVADGAVKVSEAELLALIAETQKRFEDKLGK